MSENTRTAYEFLQLLWFMKAFMLLAASTLVISTANCMSVE